MSNQYFYDILLCWPRLYSGKRNVTVWRASVCPSVCSCLFLGILTVTYQGAACDSASVNYGQTIRRIDLYTYSSDRHRYMITTCCCDLRTDEKRSHTFNCQPGRCLFVVRLASVSSCVFERNAKDNKTKRSIVVDLEVVLVSVKDL